MDGWLLQSNTQGRYTHYYKNKQRKSTLPNAICSDNLIMIYYVLEIVNDHFLYFANFLSDHLSEMLLM